LSVGATSIDEPCDIYSQTFERASMNLREQSTNCDVFLSLKVSMPTNKYIARKRSTVNDIANPSAPIVFHVKVFWIEGLRWDNKNGRRLRKNFNWS